MKKTITICTCDICSKEMEHENSNYLKWHFTAKDYLGNGCADGGVAYHDICDRCIEKLDKSICETIEQIRKEN